MTEGGSSVTLAPAEPTAPPQPPAEHRARRIKPRRPDGRARRRQFLLSALAIGSVVGAFLAATQIEALSEPLLTFLRTGKVVLELVIVLYLGLVVFGLLVLMKERRLRREVGERWRAEERRRLAEERYRQIVEDAFEGMFQTTVEGGFVSANPACAAVFGYSSPAELMTDVANVRDLYVDPFRRDELLRLLARDGSLHGGEAQVLTRDGGVRWISIHARALRDESGALTGLDGTLADITERKRGEAEIKALLRQQRAIAGLLQAALVGGDLQSLMDQTVEVLARTLEVDIAGIHEISQQGDELVLQAGTGWRGASVGEMRAEMSMSSVAGFTILSNEPVVFEDLEADTRFSKAALLREGGVVSGLTVTIHGPDRPFGVLGAYSSVRRQFSQQDVNFLRVLAGLMADMIQRKKAEEDLLRTLSVLEKTDEQRRNLLSRLVGAQEEERQRIAADIHDDSIQVMVALGLRLQILQEELEGSEHISFLAQLEDTLQRTIARLRYLIFELRPPALDREGLGPALRAYLEQTMASLDIAHRVENHLVVEPPLETRVIIYRIAQEVLANVRKHAEAKKVDVLLEDADNGVIVTIRDDGVGFSPQKLLDSLPGHLGLVAMRERAEMAGGWLKLRSVPGTGTTVEFWIPAQARA